MTGTVGVIGLGIMGSTFARHLLAAGVPVVGFDIDARQVARFEADGGQPTASPLMVAQAAPVVFTLLPSEAALESVMAGEDGLTSAGPQDLTLVECSTMSLKAKHWAAERLAAIGAGVLDCPISGTGVQAARKELSFYASGDEARFEAVRDTLALLGRDVFYLGAFGNGTKTKLISNLLVAIHNVAAAEALTLGRKAGLDPDTLLRTISAGAGSSRMLEVRGPMMIAGAYGGGDSSRLDVFRKDLSLIGAFCTELGSSAPVFDLCSQLYQTAIAQGMENLDPGAVCRVIERLSGFEEEA
jgi:L-threonate 2-dehydrogenase